MHAPALASWLPYASETSSYTVGQDETIPHGSVLWLAPAPVCFHVLYASIFKFLDQLPKYGFILCHHSRALWTPLRSGPIPNYGLPLCYRKLNLWTPLHNGYTYVIADEQIADLT